MQKVITINLNGNAYQVEEGGYGALLTYLDGAQRQLLDNPDRAEIIADLEQAIADKCRAFISPHKTVVTNAEVDQIIREMGPVDAGTSAPASAGAPAADAGPRPAGRSGPKRLYRIPDDAVWMGVCSGIGAYVGIDPVFVRILFLILVVFSGGLALLGYWLLAVSIPEASTLDERAAAHGQQPLNAQDVVDRAKKEYADFKGDRREQRRRWREQRRAWKQQWRAARWSGAYWGAPAMAAGAYGPRIVTGVMAPILGLVSFALFAMWAFAVYSLVTTHAVLGQPLPDDMPLWGGILILVIVYQMVSWPLHAARRHAIYAASGGAYYGAGAAWDGMLSLVFVIFMVWLAYHYVPEVREILRAIPDVLRSFGIDVS